MRHERRSPHGHSNISPVLASTHAHAHAPVCLCFLSTSQYSLHALWSQADFDTVAMLQRNAFERTLSAAPRLNFSRLGWTDADVQQFASVAAAATLPHCTRLELEANAFGDAGLVALASAIKDGALPALENLQLNANRGIGDSGLVALSDAIADGKLSELRMLRLGGNSVGDEGLRALASALRRGGGEAGSGLASWLPGGASGLRVPKLSYVHLIGNSSSEAARDEVRAACNARDFTPAV